MTIIFNSAEIMMYEEAIRSNLKTVFREWCWNKMEVNKSGSKNNKIKNKRRINRIWNKSVRKRSRKRNKNLKKYERMVKFKIEEIKELEINLKELKLVESEQKIKKQTLKGTRIRLWSE